jgi:predicted RecA/RadA family phage recombinase
MILDYQNVLSDAQAITATTTSTYYIDTLAAGDAVLPGAMIEYKVDTTLAGNTGTMTATLDTATSSDISTGKVTLLTLTSAAAIGAKGTVAKDSIRVVIPPGCLRYLFMTYTVGSGPYTSGKVDARIVLQGDKTMDKTL